MPQEFDSSNKLQEDQEISVLRSQLVLPGPQAWAACKALGHHPSIEAFDILVELTRSPDWSYRHAAIRAIATHRLGRSAGDLLTALLKDESPYVVRAACDAISQLRLQDAHDAVLSLLHSPDAVTRSTALDALVVLWVPSDFGIVYNLFCGDASRAVRRRAAWALRAHPDRENWRALFRSWSGDSLSRHRQWACEVTEEFGDVGIRVELEPLLQDIDGHVRKAARNALARLMEDSS
jgi:HEAT repeat protein